MASAMDGLRFQIAELTNEVVELKRDALKQTELARKYWPITAQETGATVGAVEDLALATRKASRPKPLDRRRL